MLTHVCRKIKAAEAQIATILGPQAKTQLVPRGSPADPMIKEDEFRYPDNWPQVPTPFKHGLADRAVRGWPAVLHLLTSNSYKRILIFEGPSGYSKSALLGAAEKYAKALCVTTS